MLGARVALATTVLFAASASARADPIEEPIFVLVFSDGEDRSGFIGSLRIQLAGQAKVVAAGTFPAGSLPDRLSLAASQVSARGASLGVWFDRGNDGTFVLYAVGARKDRGVIEVGRSEIGGADSERVLALKVSALVDEVIEERASAGAILGPAVVPERVAAQAVPSPREARLVRVAGFATVGGTAALHSGEPRAQGGAMLGGGMRLKFPRWSAETSISAHVFGDRVLENESGTATLSEFGGSISIAGFADVGQVHLGARLRAGVHRISATAMTIDGAAGGAESTIPSLELLGALQWRVGRLSIEFSGGAGINLISERMTIRDQVVVDLERVRYPLDLSLALIF